jgi:hypothetical protein
MEISIDKRGAIRNNRPRIRNWSWFPYYHIVSGLDLSAYQIFSKDQLEGYDEKFTDHCFVNCRNSIK